VRLWLYVVRRAIIAVPVLIGVMTIMFVLASALPTQQRLEAQFGTPSLHDPWAYQPTRPCPPPNTNRACSNPGYYVYLDRLGLNQPIPVQWAHYLGTLFGGQWGKVGNGSTAGTVVPDIGGSPVLSVLLSVAPYSLELGILAGAILIALGIPLGVWAAANRNQASDVGVRSLVLTFRALPTFLLGNLFLLVIFLWLGSLTHFQESPPWCPSGETTVLELFGSWPPASCFAGGRFPLWLPHGVATLPTGLPTLDAFLNGQPWLGVDSLLRLILPAFVLAFASMALLVRYVRASMLEVLNLEYVRTARAEGIVERDVLRRHAGKNTMNLTFTVLGLTFATFLGWFPVIEVVFGLNGIGSLLALSAMSPFDFGLLFGGTFLLSILAIVTSLIVDLLYAYFDPRVRLG
jgi:ABC-type dipeptide/oligopeptide/nickel transport system permease component